MSGFEGSASGTVPPEFGAVLEAREAAVRSIARPPEAMVVLLATLPRGHGLRTRPLGELMAECRNKLSKEWRSVVRWRIAASSYDDLGPAWTDTSDFRVPAPRQEASEVR